VILAVPFAITLVIRAHSAMPASQERQIETMDLLDDPLARFSKLMPVFLHDRCVNCHGDVDPFTGENHEGGQLEPARAAPLIGPDGNQRLGPEFNGPCTESGCHSAPHARFWAIAPKEMKFSGHTAASLCRQIQHTPRFDKAALLKKHFHEDELIAAAFIGQRGFPDRSPEPPGSAAEFVSLADKWLEGSEDVPCSGWVGTITQTETVDLTTHHNRSDPTGNEQTTEIQRATRRIDVTLADGQVTLRIAVQGTESIENTVVTQQDGRSCTTTGKAVTTFGTPNGETSGEARSAKVIFLPGNKYELSIKGPVEHTSGVERSTLVNCVLGNVPSDPEPKDFTHSGWVVAISGIRSDPSDRMHLEGTTTETRTEDDAWLTRKGGALRASQTRDNGELLPVPVEVKTTWNLTRRNN
jgi:hypothetical protein